MNQFVSIVLIIFALAWLLYMAGLRDKRIAFAFWFPITATSFFGTLIWLWVSLLLLFSRRAQGEAEGWMVYGAAMVFGIFLICPIVFAISLWQRPKSGSYGLIQTLPIIGLFFGLIFFYRPLSEAIENRKLQLVVLDTQMNPIADAKVEYETNQRSSGGISAPSLSMNGEVETGPDGMVVLPVPQTHEMDCNVSMVGYAHLSIRMDRAWGKFNWHQTWVEWQFPPDNPKKLWEAHGGQVETDVDDASLMHLVVYLPKTSAESIPNYGPMRVCADGEGKVWVSEPSKVTTH